METTGTKSKTFMDLIVWQKAHGLVLSIYGLTKGFPQSEMYGLTSQPVKKSMIYSLLSSGFWVLSPILCASSTSSPV